MSVYIKYISHSAPGSSQDIQTPDPLRIIAAVCLKKRSEEKSTFSSQKFKSNLWTRFL